SFVKSDISATLKIVAMNEVETPQPDAKSDPDHLFVPILDDLDKPKPLRWSTVKTNKQTTGAHFGVLVVDANDPRECGMASGYGVPAERAFAVVNWRCIASRASFIHEIGHLIGLYHDQRTRVESDGPGVIPNPPYAQGLIT